MNRINVCILIFILFSSLLLFSQDIPVQYLSPLPESKYNNKETNIIISSNRTADKNIIGNKGNITVEGSISGLHKGEVLIASDGRTIIFKPFKPFSLSETVHVKLSSRITGKPGSFEYKFYVKDKEIAPTRSDYFLKELGMKYFNNSLFPVSNIYSDSLPANFPSPTVMVSNNPSPSKIFLTCFSFFPSYGTYLMIFNNDGTPYFYRNAAFPTDFKKILNGNLVYFDGDKAKYYELDTNYFIVDSFYTGNGYTTDQHELKYLANGNAYLMSYDPVFVNMSQIIQGGDTNALVTGLIIQEIDANKNVIFQWRSWDHIPITDCSNQDLLNDTIDYVHGNAIEPDTDGNIMISSRHLDEITKINRTTGAIMWRLGGGKSNQFTFINDTDKFNFQHDIRRLKNGHITLFDNGNAHTPPYSRAVEYDINEQAKTATLVWQFRSNPDIFGPFMGNVQRLDNGNTMIGWGGTIAEPVTTFTEVSPNGTKLLEMKLPNFVFSYRAYKFDWDFPEIKIPATYALKQNYPNPFNPETKIEFDIPEPTYVQLKIYNILGAEVATLVNQFLQPRIYIIKWNAGSYASGVYFYQIISNKLTETKKMVLIR